MSILESIPSFFNPAPKLLKAFVQDPKLAYLFFQLQRFPAAISTLTYIPSINFFEQEAVELWTRYRLQANSEYTAFFNFCIEQKLIHKDLLLSDNHIPLNKAAEKIVVSLSLVINLAKSIDYLSHNKLICIETTEEIVQSCNQSPILGIALKEFYTTTHASFKIYFEREFNLSRSLTDQEFIYITQGLHNYQTETETELQSSNRSIQTFVLFKEETTPSSADDISTITPNSNLSHSTFSIPELLPEIEIDFNSDILDIDLDLSSIFNH